MSTYYLLYHGLILAALIFSAVAFYRGHRYVLPIAIVLLLTLLIELASDFMMRRHIQFVWLYHVFNLFEYSLFSFYLMARINNKTIKKTVGYSILLFCLTSLAVSLFFYRFKGFPGINIDLEGLLLFLSGTYVLFNLESEQKYIFAHHDFWICIGILIFFGCTFLFNGVYSRLLRLDEKRALDLFAVVSRPLNIALYTFIITGLVCLIAKKRSTTPSSS